MAAVDDTATLRSLRKALLVLFLFAVCGTTAELLLLAHDEDAIQLIPIVLAVAGAVVALWNLVRPSAAGLRTFQLLMLLFIASGGAGVFYHYQANVEFQLEMDATLRGTALLWQVLQAKAPPALSPGLMVQLGLLGFAYTYRHPALRHIEES